jgi:hypothetical protein
MAFEQRSLDDYIDVAQRIADFRTLYPIGSLRGDFRMVEVGGQSLVAYRAEAWRTPDDDAPGVGCAWELVPGRTPFTKGSELQNAETSAWGRAIVAVGASDSKKGIASREEVRNRREDQDAADQMIAEAREMRRRPPEVDEHGAATQAEQTRMSTGPEPGTSRLSATPEGEPWYDAQVPLADLPNPEDRHGTATADQIRTLQARFTDRNVKDRDEKVRWLAERFGPDIRSSKDLSYSQAATALLELT